MKWACHFKEEKIVFLTSERKLKVLNKNETFSKLFIYHHDVLDSLISFKYFLYIKIYLTHNVFKNFTDKKPELQRDLKTFSQWHSSLAVDYNWI